MNGCVRVHPELLGINAALLEVDCCFGGECEAENSPYRSGRCSSFVTRGHLKASHCKRHNGAFG